MKKKSILIIGPKAAKRKNSYGGGAGGYVANLQRYESLLKEYFIVDLFYLSVRENNFLMLVNFPLRFFYDLIRFIYVLNNSSYEVVHLLGQYRMSIYRELFLVFFAKLFKKKVIYDIRAGAFISAYNEKKFIYKFFTNTLIKIADTFLVESYTYKNFIQKKFKKDSYYIPNFLPSNMINNYEKKLKQKTKNKKLFNLLFVGNASEAKGILQLVEATKVLSREYKNIRLNLVGNIEKNIYKSKDFKELLNRRLLLLYGVLSQEKIYKLMLKCSVYVYPTMHKGEGHNNSINEAAFFELPIITTKNGFLSEAFDKSEIYFLKNYRPVKTKEIVNQVKKIINYPEESKNKTCKAKNKITENYTSKAVINNLLSAYKS